MIDSKQVIADFQFLGNRVSKFEIETRDIDHKEAEAHLAIELDYNIVDLDKNDNNYFGCLEFIVVIKAKIKNSILFKIYLNMEGAFIGNKEKIEFEVFQKMLEMNGLTTLSQLSRAYIISATALSGINPPIKMPMINVLSLIKQKREKEEKIKSNLDD